MADIFTPPISAYPSPAQGYEGKEPLGEERNEDGKSLKNPETGVKSEAYERFTHPLDNGRRGGFDVHIYHFQNNPDHVKYARELHDRIRREFPELRIYRFFDKPVGPHPVAMFEVNLLSPAEFGAFIPWLAVWRGPLSALVHPNTVPPEGAGKERIGLEARKDHTTRAIWMGERLPLDTTSFERMAATGSFVPAPAPAPAAT